MPLVEFDLRGLAPGSAPAREEVAPATGADALLVRGPVPALAAHPDVVARLVALFETRFSPDRNAGRAARTEELVASLRQAIAAVESLDADRVLTALLAEGIEPDELPAVLPHLPLAPGTADAVLTLLDAGR